MQLRSVEDHVDGIRCDLCGGASSGDFTYYSVDARAVPVVDNRFGGVDQLPTIFTMDVDAACLADLESTIKACYAPTNVGANCDLCAATMRGTFTFYYLTVSRVDVSASTATVRCRVCGQPTGGCRCGNRQRLANVARLLIDDKYLQLSICQRDYDRLVDTAMAARAKHGQT